MDGGLAPELPRNDVLKLLAYGIGTRPIRMLGSPTSFRSGWIASYLFSFATQLPMEPEIPAIGPRSSPDSSPRGEPDLKGRREAREKLNPELPQLRG